MADPRASVRHEMERLELRAFTLDEFHTRRDRKRRGQRTGATIVAIAVFVLALWLVASGRPGHRTQTPAATGPTGLSSSPAPWQAISVAPYYSADAGSGVDYVIDLRNGETTPLPDAITGSLDQAADGRSAGALTRYAASSDGSMLAFVGTGREGTPQIFIAGIDGIGVHQVTHDPTGADSPAWSPDGTLIAYVGHGGGDVPNVFVLDVAAGKATQITNDQGDGAFVPTFTPDGRSLIYDGGSDQVPALRILPLDGGKSRLLVRPSEGIVDSGNGTLSPDGSLVTFLGGGSPTSGEVEHCGPCRLVANADGTDRRVIGGWMATPAGMWSPDGSRIVTMDIATAYNDLSSPIGPNLILVVDVASGRPTIVANGRAAIWLDDHTLLVAV